MGYLFYPGQHVICINDNFSWSRKQYPDPRIGYPTFGKRYIIRAYVAGGKYPAVVLQEIRNPDVVYIGGKVLEAGFWDKRFVGAPPPIEGQMVTEKEKEMA